MTVRIADEMRSFSRRLLPAGDRLPFWAESALRQHAEYAANDYCKSRGLQGLDAVSPVPALIVLGLIGWSMARA